MFRQWSSLGISGGGDELPVIKKEIEGAQRNTSQKTYKLLVCLSGAYLVAGQTQRQSKSNRVEDPEGSDN